jgi:hypothetical protein
MANKFPVHRGGCRPRSLGNQIGPHPSNSLEVTEFANRIAARRRRLQLHRTASSLIAIGTLAIRFTDMRASKPPSMGQ